MERHDRGGHHRELRVILGHLVDRGVGPLDGELHQVFNVGAVFLMTKSFIKNFDGGLRCDLAGFRSADAVGDSEDSTRAVMQECVFVKGAALVEPAVAKR
jgi:hypothetical protein